jgi:hypothetical protein
MDLLDHMFRAARRGRSIDVDMFEFLRDRGADARLITEAALQESLDSPLLASDSVRLKPG